jgi:hypothetical protein
MGEQIAELRALLVQRWLEFRPVLRRLRATAEIYYLRLERAEVDPDWRKRPSNIGSVALHSLALIVLIIWAHPWAKAGGPSKVVSVQVVMIRSSVADATANASRQRSPQTPSSSLTAQPTAPSPQVGETVAASLRSSDLSTAARQDTTPLPKQESESSKKTPKTVAPSSPSSAATSAKNNAVNGAPVAAGSQNVALQNALRSQMIACWNAPFMAGRGGLVAVDFDLVLNPDGTLTRPPELTPNMAEEAPHNPGLRAAADAARQALKFCAPFKLPRDTYDQWHEINPFHFDPSEFVPH